MSSKKTPAGDAQPAEPKAAKVNVRRFLVEDGLRSISHGEQVFPVKEGMVELPQLPADQCWYTDLVQAGILVEE